MKSMKIIIALFICCIAVGEAVGSEHPKKADAPTEMVVHHRYRRMRQAQATTAQLSRNQHAAAYQAALQQQAEQKKEIGAQQTLQDRIALPEDGDEDQEAKRKAAMVAHMQKAGILARIEAHAQAAEPVASASASPGPRLAAPAAARSVLSQPAVASSSAAAAALEGERKSAAQAIDYNEVDLPLCVGCFMPAAYNGHPAVKTGEANTVMQLPCCKNLFAHYMCADTVKEKHLCQGPKASKADIICLPCKGTGKNKAEECEECNGEGIMICKLCTGENSYTTHSRVILPCINKPGNCQLCLPCYEKHKLNGCPFCRDASASADRQKLRDEAEAAYKEQKEAQEALAQLKPDAGDAKRQGAAAAEIAQYKKGDFATQQEVQDYYRTGQASQALQVKINNVDASIKQQLQTWPWRFCVVCDKRIQYGAPAKNVPFCQKNIQDGHGLAIQHPYHLVHEECAKNCDFCKICQRTLSQFDKNILEFGLDQAIEMREAVNRRNDALRAQAEAKRQAADGDAKAKDDAARAAVAQPQPQQQPLGGAVVYGQPAYPAAPASYRGPHQRVRQRLADPAVPAAAGAPGGNPQPGMVMRAADTVDRLFRNRWTRVAIWAYLTLAKPQRKAFRWGALSYLPIEMGSTNAATERFKTMATLAFLGMKLYRQSQGDPMKALKTTWR